MRKNKFYIIVFILNIILVFSTAATFRLCGMPVEIETEEEITEEEGIVEELLEEVVEEETPAEEVVEESIFARVI